MFEIDTEDTDLNRGSDFESLLKDLQLDFTTNLDDNTPFNILDEIQLQPLGDKRSHKKRIVSPCQPCTQSLKRVLEQWNERVMDISGHPLDMSSCAAEIGEENQNAARLSVLNAARETMRDVFQPTNFFREKYINKWQTNRDAFFFTQSLLPEKDRRGPPTDNMELTFDRFEELLYRTNEVDALPMAIGMLERLTAQFISYPSFIHRECRLCGSLDRVQSSFMVLTPPEGSPDYSWSDKVGSASNFNGGPGNCAKKVSTRKFRGFRTYLKSANVDVNIKRKHLDAWNERATQIYEKLRQRVENSSVKRTMKDVVVLFSKPLSELYTPVETNNGVMMVLPIFPISITRSPKHFFRVPIKARGHHTLEHYLMNMKDYAFLSNNDRKIKLRENPTKVFGYDCFMSEKERTHVVRNVTNGGTKVWVSHVFKNRDISHASEDQLISKFSALRRHSIRNLGLLQSRELKTFRIPRSTEYLNITGRRGLSNSQLKKLCKRYHCTVSITPNENSEVENNKMSRRYRIEFEAPKAIVNQVKRELQEFIKKDLNDHISSKQRTQSEKKQVENLEPVVNICF